MEWKELFCLTSTETRLFIRGRGQGGKGTKGYCLLGTGTRGEGDERVLFIRDGDKGGRGRKGEGSIAGTNPEAQDAVDRRQNNKMPV